MKFLFNNMPIRQQTLSLHLLASLIMVVFFSLAAEVVADDEKASQGSEKTKTIPAELRKIIKQAVPLNRQKTLFLDAKKKCLYLQGKVVLNAGLLEMLCCKEQSKEHESIISVNCKAYPIHTGLLALQAKPGTPVSFEPEYRPPTGEKLEITVIFVNAKGKLEQQDVRQWIRTVTRRYFIGQLARLPEGLMIPDDSELKYDRRRKELLHFGTLNAKELKRLQGLSEDKDYHQALKTIHKNSQPSILDADWVFAGSGFQVDPQSGKQRYLAEMGDFI